MPAVSLVYPTNGPCWLTGNNIGSVTNDIDVGDLRELVFWEEAAAALRRLGLDEEATEIAAAGRGR